VSGLTWVFLYLIDLVFWIWVVRLGGAERLEGTLASGCLISIFAPRWSAEGIKAAGWLVIVLSTIWFVIGLFSPSLRL